MVFQNRQPCALGSVARAQDKSPHARGEEEASGQDLGISRMKVKDDCMRLLLNGTCLIHNNALN